MESTPSYWLEKLFTWKSTMCAWWAHVVLSLSLSHYNNLSRMSGLDIMHHTVNQNTIFEKVRADWDSNCQLLALRWCTLWLSYPETRVHPPQKSLKNPFFALYETGVWLRHVISWEGFPKLRFSIPGLLPVCMLWYLPNNLTEYDKIFTQVVKSPADSRYDVRIDIQDP